MGHARCGHCAVFLVAALVMDVAGLALVLAGAVGQPVVDGRPLEDFLVLTGSLLLALSLLCWLFWYSGNLRGVPAEELPLGARPVAAAAAGATQPRRRQSLLRLAAKLSERLSQRRRPAPAPCAALGFVPAKATRGAAAAAAAAAAATWPRPDGPVELSRLRPAAQPEAGVTRTEERLV